MTSKPEPAHPSAPPSAWRLRREPVHREDDLLPFFDPFGRNSKDKQADSDLSRVLRLIALMYNELRHPHRLSDTRRELTRLYLGLHQSVSAMRALGRPAANYILGYSPHPESVVTSPSGGQPGKRSKAFEATFDRALGSLADEYHRRNDELAPKAITSDHERFGRVCHELHMAWQDYEHVMADPGAAEQEKDAARHLVEQAKDALDVVQLFARPAPFLHPYLILDAKAAEIANMRDLVKMALDHFASDWPKSLSKRGRKGNTRSVMPQDALAGMLVLMIAAFWRGRGLDRITSTPAGDFEELLVKFHFYACNEDLREPRFRADGKPIDERPFAEVLEKRVAGYVAAERERLKLPAKRSRATKAT